MSISLVFYIYKESINCKETLERIMQIRNLVSVGEEMKRLYLVSGVYEEKRVIFKKKIYYEYYEGILTVFMSNGKIINLPELVTKNSKKTVYILYKPVEDSLIQSFQHIHYRYSICLLFWKF